MAPSRALPILRRITSTRPNLASRTLSSAAPRALSTSQLPQRPFHRCQQRTRVPSTHVPAARSYSAAAPEPPDYLNEAELHIFNKIKGELAPVKLEVQDISGGCGSMYAIEIESSKFKGLSVIKQHKLVNQVLKEEIAGWHGVQLRTKAA